MPKKRIQIDGRTLEGGGQLLRNALCISAMTGQPIEIINIRANRAGGGGLGHQHLVCVKWLAHACRARVKGAEYKSRTLLFEPEHPGGIHAHSACSPAFKKVMKDDQLWYECQIKQDTAGSTGLALQAILPFILFSKLPIAAPIRLTVTGGTNVSGSPSYEYICQVLLPTLRNLGFPEIKARLHRRGWSQGAQAMGSFILEIPPRGTIAFPAFQLSSKLSSIAERGDRMPNSIHATFLAPDGHTLGELLRNRLRTTVSRMFRETVEITTEVHPSGHAKRMYLILVADIPLEPVSQETGEGIDIIRTPSVGKIACDWLYDRKIVSHERCMCEMIEHVTVDLATQISTGAAVDSHMRDQLVIFQALAQSRSLVCPGTDESGVHRLGSLHTQTAVWVAEKMMGAKAERDGSCNGIGYGADEKKQN